MKISLSCISKHPLKEPGSHSSPTYFGSTSPWSGINCVSGLYHGGHTQSLVQPRWLSDSCITTKPILEWELITKLHSWSSRHDFKLSQSESFLSSATVTAYITLGERLSKSCKLQELPKTFQFCLLPEPSRFHLCHESYMSFLKEEVVQPTQSKLLYNVADDSTSVGPLTIPLQYGW